MIKIIKNLSFVGFCTIFSAVAVIGGESLAEIDLNLYNCIYETISSQNLKINCDGKKDLIPQIDNIVKKTECSFFLWNKKQKTQDTFSIWSYFKELPFYEYVFGEENDNYDPGPFFDWMHEQDLCITVKSQSLYENPLLAFVVGVIVVKFKSAWIFKRLESVDRHELESDESVLSENVPDDTDDHSADLSPADSDVCLAKCIIPTKRFYVQPFVEQSVKFLYIITKYGTFKVMLTNFDNEEYLLSILNSKGREIISIKKPKSILMKLMPAVLKIIGYESFGQEEQDVEDSCDEKEEVNDSFEGTSFADNFDDFRAELDAILRDSVSEEEDSVFDYDGGTELNDSFEGTSFADNLDGFQAELDAIFRDPASEDYPTSSAEESNLLDDSFEGTSFANNLDGFQSELNAILHGSPSESKEESKELNDSFGWTLLLSDEETK